MLKTRFARHAQFAALFILLWQAPGMAQADEIPAIADWLRKQVDAHPSVQAAKQQSLAAGAGLRAADKALFNPELEIDVEDTGVRTSQLGISQQIDWGDARGSRTRVAQFRQQAAMLGLTETRHHIAAQLLTALSAWQGARAEQQLAEKRLQLMTRFAELAQLRYRAGDLNQVEADLATLALSEARFQAATAKSAAIDARQTLLALATETEDWPTLPEQMAGVQLSQQEVDALVKQLPAVRRANAEVMAAREQVALARSEASANPTIAVRGGREGDESLIGLNLSIPLQVRNNFRAEIDAANARYLAVQSEAQQVYRQARSGLRSALSAWQLSLSAWRQWLSSGERSLSQQIGLLQRLWKTGELSTTDYLVQLKQSLDTRAVALQQRSLMWRNWAQWLLASGRIQHWLQTDDTKPLPNGDAAVAGE